MPEIILGPPRCAKCQRQVDRFYIAPGPNQLSVIVGVECHGEFEQHKLTVFTVMECSSITVGEAFATPKLAVA